MARGGTELSSWASSLLHRLGIHQTPGAIQALTGWARAEGGHFANDAKYNVLNTTQEMPGARNTGSQGNIKVYRNWDQGLEATVKTLKNGRYDGVLHALAAGDPGAVAHAVGASPWGTNGALLAKTIASAPRVAGAHPLDGAHAPTPAPHPGTRANAASAGYLQDPSTETIRPDSTRQRVELAMEVLKRKDKGVLDLAQGMHAQDVADAAATQTVTTPGVKLPGAPQGAPTRSESTFHGEHPMHGVATFDGVKVAAWIKPELEYARKHGWKGKVNSGVRTDAEQTAIYRRGTRPAAVPKSMGGPGSNHEGTDLAKHRGAVDVSDPQDLHRILSAKPGGSPLKWAGQRDVVHFSSPHNGSY